MDFAGLPSINGLSWFGVLVIESLPPSLSSHAQPEPKRPTPAAANCSLNFSKSPNDDLIASPTLPPGAPPALGPINSQNNVWFQCPPPLLRTAVRTASGTLLMPESNCSSDCLPSSGAFSTAEFRLVT